MKVKILFEKIAGTMLLKLLILTQVIHAVLSIHAKMTTALLNSGFHRSAISYLISTSFLKHFPFDYHRILEYTTVFPMLDEDFNYCIEQELPSAVYVSTDQLDDMKRFGKVKFLIIDQIKLLQSNFFLLCTAKSLRGRGD